MRPRSAAAELPLRTAVVTGGGSGLGRALCMALAQTGARVLVSDVDASRADDVARHVTAGGGQALAMAVDVSNATQMEQLGAAADEFLGGTDLLVNNAGVAVAGEVGSIALADWDWILGINLRGVILGCHVFIPRMKQHGHGAILNVASAAGIACAARMAPYNATKAAVIALSETLYAELAPANIRVTVLCPTFFRTNLLQSLRTSDAATRDLAVAAFARSRMTAEAVASHALRAVAKRQLYCLPMRDGRIIWYLKRLFPAAYARFFGSQRVIRFIEGQRKRASP